MRKESVELFLQVTYAFSGHDLIENFGSSF